MKFSDVEAARQKYLDKRSRALATSAVIIIIVFLCAFILPIIFNMNLIQYALKEPGQNILMLIVVFSIWALAIGVLGYVIAFSSVKFSTREEMKKYKNTYKSFFAEQQLEKVFTDVCYLQDKGLERNILADTGMIYVGDRYSSSDFASGKYKDVGFMQADVHIEKKYKDAESDTHFSTVFLGKYIVLEFPKKIGSRMMLSNSDTPLQKTAEYNGKTLEHIKTESSEFNKVFSVYTDDSVEALYILTPDFMERIQKLGELHGNKISVYFSGNKMIIGINDDANMFEPPDPRKPLDKDVEKAKVAKDIELLTYIIDYLKLNRHKSK